jgi:hypothetical protein
MSNSEHSGLVQLDVSTSDTATEIFVIDGLFRLAQKGLGKLTAQLQPGIYKLRIRAGYAEQEDYVVLRDEPVLRSYSIRFSSPVPLRDTAEDDPRHIAAAERESQAIHVPHGTGSCIFLFARRWSSTAGNQGIFHGTHPAKGISLTNSNGTEVANMEAASVVDLTGNPWAACAVQVDPGLYRLSLRTPQGDRLEQTIVAAAARQTQVFLLQRTSGAGQEAQAALPDTSIILSSHWRFDAESPHLRLAELARLGLRNDRQVLSDAILDALLVGEFEDPMLGLFGAHRLLRQKHPEVLDLSQVVKKLRDLLGTQHPDVEALALLLGSGPTPYVFGAPPMLRKSWPLILEATVQNAALVPSGSLASRVANYLSVEEPWLLWSALRDEAQEAIMSEHLARIADILGRRIQGEMAVPEPQRHPWLDALAARILKIVQEFGWPLLKGRTLQLPTEIKLPTEAVRVLPPSMDEATMKTLVETLRIPRANVKALLDKMQGSPQ